MHKNIFLRAVIFSVFIGILCTNGCVEELIPPNEDVEDIEETDDYLLIYKLDCEPTVILEEQEIESEYELPNFFWAIVNLTENRSLELKPNPCILYLLTPEEAKDLYQNLSEGMKKYALQIIKQLQMNRTIDNDDLPEEPPDLLNNHQTFVTPDDPAIQEIANRISNSREAYREAVQWVWVSEQTLNGKRELWLKPNEFLIETPTYPTNPVPGRIASDCEEQANTLVSLLRAIDVPPSEIRVVLGTVDFDGNVGGHAWVEIYEDGKWLQLEATSGPYWDDEQQKLVNSNGMSYSHYKFFDYPVEEVWSYYNDYYYYNPRNGRGNPPDLWL